MKTKMIYGFVILFLMALTGASALYAEGDDSSSSGATDGAGLNALSVVPSDPVGVVVDQDAENDSDPSEFEGDSGSMPGERAPEELPMSDTPADAGVGIE